MPFVRGMGGLRAQLLHPLLRKRKDLLQGIERVMHGEAAGIPSCEVCERCRKQQRYGHGLFRALPPAMPGRDVSRRPHTIKIVGDVILPSRAYNHEHWLGRRLHLLCFSRKLIDSRKVRQGSERGHDDGEDASTRPSRIRGFAVEFGPTCVKPSRSKPAREKCPFFDC